ncbi:WD40-repeat-containing domain protein [Lentinula aciculospora]|uniref:WD40-repeat-containing domain protein n=1 Tax=Lentinula aciculospora TaxID=153920 RepID=A0A9W9AMZ6_9AGAR|nr:WD40-repeat-containing domain protein [Lentinula aciculospora]
MPKHSRKRQKLSTDGPHSLTQESAKDDEERRLESLVFGTKYVPAGSKEFDAELAEGEGEGRQLQNLLDNDLFFVDDELEHGSDHSDLGDPELSGLDSGFGSQSENEEETEEPAKKTSPLAKGLKFARRTPAWIDDSDPANVSLSSKRLKKLRNAPDEETLPGREYESRLRRQFERINPEPHWANKARKKKSHSDDEAETDFNALLTSTSGIRQSRSLSSQVLASSTIDISRLRDANQSAQNSGCGDIKSLAFHPSERVPVLCVGSSDRRVRMYNIDGHTSPLLQTLHIPSLPLSSQTSVAFHPTGSQLLLTGSRPYYFVYDLQSGALRSSEQSKHGLWGTRFEDPSATLQAPMPSRKRGRTRGVGVDENVAADSQSNPGAPGMEVTAFEPSTGSMLAVAGRGGYVHLVDWKSGAGQVIGSLKCSNGGGGVKGLWWASPSSERSPELATGSRECLTVLTGDSEVYLWDVGERRCVRRWKDEGGFRGAGRVLTGNGKGSSWLAIGSNTGLVNVYGADSFTPASISTSPSSSSSWSSISPKPLKTIGNLTTPISTLRFNHDAQVLAMASKEKKDGMRLIHLPSLTSFSNWPTSSTPLGHVTAVDFSALSEYIAIGNTRGRVLLYHLKNFGAH